MGGTIRQRLGGALVLRQRTGVARLGVAIALGGMALGALGTIFAALRIPVLSSEPIDLPSPQRSPTGIENAPKAQPSPDREWLALITHDPFRPSRSPAQLLYDPSQTSNGAPPAAGAPAKPRLVATGILWGPRPEAVIEGVPGIEGPRVVRAAEVLGKLRIQRIERDRVVITGFDTTWALTVREPWR